MEAETHMILSLDETDTPCSKVVPNANYPYGEITA